MIAVLPIMQMIAQTVVLMQQLTFVIKKKIQEAYECRVVFFCKSL